MARNPKTQRSRPSAPKGVRAQPIDPRPAPVGDYPVGDYKNHPVIVALASGAATLLLCVGVFTQVILPTQTAKLEVEILKQKTAIDAGVKERDDLRAAKKRLEDDAAQLKRRANEAEAEKARLAAQLLAAEADHPFAAASPYPAGFDQVHIGDPAVRVEEVYGKDRIHQPEDRDYIEVKADRPPFETAVYYYDAADSRRRITHVGFRMEILNHYPAGYLLSKLEGAFGQPTEHPRKDYRAWKIGTVFVYSSDDDGVLVMDAKYSPAYWPDKP